MRQCDRIVLATSSIHKFEEFKSLFSAYGNIEILMARDVLRNADKVNSVEGSTSYLDNAAAKARLVNQGCHYPALADDSGLEVDALQGKPGVLSARYAAFRTGVSRDQANREFLLEELKKKLPKDHLRTDRSARFVATLALEIEGVLISAVGVLEGNITDVPRGEGGFGYDPVFVPKGFQKTLAEMTLAEKNSISHRAKALQELMNKAAAIGLVFAKP